jgi:PPE-repeat protein
MSGFQLNVAVTCPPGVGEGHYVVVTSGLSGAPFNAVGPYFFCDSTDIVFDPPVTAVGFDLLELANPYTANIVVSDAFGGPLGSDTVVASTGGSFWGVTSAVAVGRIEITAPGDGAELIGNLEFGDAASLNAIPALSKHGTALLCVLVAIAGLVAIIQRR